MLLGMSLEGLEGIDLTTAAATYGLDYVSLTKLEGASAR